MTVEEPESIDNILHFSIEDDVKNALCEALNDTCKNTELANEANEDDIHSKNNTSDSHIFVEQSSVENIISSLLPESIPCSVGSLPTPCAPILDDLCSLSVSDRPFELLTPFNDEQLAEYYQNELLFGLQEYIEEFNQSELKKIHSSEHPLYVLLQDYLQARLKLENTKQEIKESKYSYTAHEKHIWTLEPATYTQYGECQVNIIEKIFMFKQFNFRLNRYL